MKFTLIAFSITAFLLSRLSPSFYPDPYLSVALTGIHPHSIRFAPSQESLRVCDLILFSNRSHLKLNFSRLIKFVLIIVLQSGDIEPNPGPTWKYPCGSCAGPVKSNQKSIFCDVCSMWFRTRCIGLTDDEYSHLQASPDTWACRSCLSEVLPFQCTSIPPSPSHPL